MDKVYIDALVAWFPMLLLIGVWIYYMRVMQKGGGKWNPYKVNEQILEETRRQNELLEKLLTRMDDRIAVLEKLEKK